MKHWQETAHLFERMAEHHERGEDVVLAVVTEIKGSTYRRPGAKLLIDQQGTLSGNVSGGCLEADVAEAGSEVLSGEHPRILHYDTNDDKDQLWGLGLGCNGEVDILLLPFRADTQATFLGAVRRKLEEYEPFAISYCLDSHGKTWCLVGDKAGVLERASDRDERIAERMLERFRTGTSAFYEVGEVRVFTEVLKPPPTLLVCGTGDDAMPLVALAAETGFRVVVADHRQAYLRPDRFPSAAERICHRAEEGPLDELPRGEQVYVVIKTHTARYDHAWLKLFSEGTEPYIGILGPKARHDAMLEKIPGEMMDRVYGPVGLDLGGEGPEQVALSIVSELLTVWSGRRPAHLRDRNTPIHDPQ